MHVREIKRESTSVHTCIWYVLKTLQVSKGKTVPFHIPIRKHTALFGNKPHRNAASFQVLIPFIRFLFLSQKEYNHVQRDLLTENKLFSVKLLETL